MTDLLNGLCKKNVKLQAIFIENGWLELDTLDDFELYQKMQSNDTLSTFYKINN